MIVSLTPLEFRQRAVSLYGSKVGVVDGDKRLTYAEYDLRVNRLANALLSVAAEREHTCPDLLILQRVVFTGGDKLGAYFEEEGGQFRRWLVEPECDPFEEVHSYVLRPPVLAYRLDG